MSEDTDLNCGSILDGGQIVEQAWTAIFKEILAIASGEPTRREMRGVGAGELRPWLQSATL